MFWPKSLLILAWKSSTSKIISPILFMSVLNGDTVQISDYQVPLKSVCSQEEMNPGPLNHELSLSGNPHNHNKEKYEKAIFTGHDKLVKAIFFMLPEEQWSSG